MTSLPGLVSRVHQMVGWRVILLVVGDVGHRFLDIRREMRQTLSAPIDRTMWLVNVVANENDIYRLK